jgi:hypothetical protein
MTSHISLVQNKKHIMKSQLTETHFKMRKGEGESGASLSVYSRSPIIKIITLVSQDLNWSTVKQLKSVKHGSKNTFFSSLVLFLNSKK